VETNTQLQFDFDLNIHALESHLIDDSLTSNSTLSSTTGSISKAAELRVTPAQWVLHFRQRAEAESILNKSRNLVLTSLTSRTSSGSSFSNLLPNHESIFSYFSQLNGLCERIVRRVRYFLSFSTDFGLLQTPDKISCKDSDPSDFVKKAGDLEVVLEWLKSEISFIGMRYILQF